MFDFYSRKDLDKELKRLDNKCNTTKDNFKIFKDKYEKDMKKLDKDIRYTNGILNDKIDYNENSIIDIKSIVQVAFLVFMICTVFLIILVFNLDRKVSNLESKVYGTQVSTEETSLGE